LINACIITYDEYLNISYVKDYEKLLCHAGIQYDIVLWNRAVDKQTGEIGIEQFCGNSCFIYRCRTRKSKASKIVPLFKWRRFVRGILKKNHYDVLIICTTLPAVLLFGILTVKYKSRFVLDIRDFTYEYLSIYRYMVKKLIHSSGMTIISSKGFLDWLPYDEKKFVITHNMTNMKTSANTQIDFSGKKPLVIGFVGGIRYFDINKKIINAFITRQFEQLITVS